MHEGNPVTLEEAQNTCAAWREMYRQLVPGVSNDDLFRGFYIPMEDIQALANIHTAVGVRAYIATDNKPGGSGITGHTLRLLLVPVNASADGVTMPGVDNIVPVDPDNPDLVSIYDFTRPCPYQCDKDSVLYNIELKIVDK